MPAETLTKVETQPEVLPAETLTKVETKPALVTEVEKTETTQVVVAANPVESVKESQPTAAVDSKETPAIVPPTAAETMPVVGTNTAVDLRNKEIVTQTETAGVNDAAPKELLPISPTVAKPIENNSTAAVTEPVKQEVAQNNNNVNADWIARLDSIKQRLSNLGGADVVAENAIDRTLIARLETMTEKLRVQTGATPISDNTAALISRLEDMVVKVAPKPVEPVQPVQFEFPKADRPLVGFITDTGLTVNNPAEEKSPIVAEEKPANSTNNPSPSANGVNSNQAQPVVRTQDNSSLWVESLIKFVDAAKVSKQPHAVVNININLTQTQPDETVIPRSELTAAERSAIAYAYQNNVIIVVPAGDNSGTMSALGLLSKEVDNVVTVGAAQRFNDSVALSNAFKLADYSGSGNTLDILANGSSGNTSSTEVAAVEVTNAIAQILAANPKLNYTQAIDIIKRTATDLDRPNWDAQTGSGLLNVAAAVQLAKVTIPELYTLKPGQRSITDVFISQHPIAKQLPGDPTHPMVKVPGIPQTNVDRGSNNLANATQLIPSATEDVIDQVSSVDPSDIYRVDSRYLNGAKFSVLSGDLSVSYLTTSGQLLGTQSFSKGSHKLQLPANAPAEVIVKIDQRNADPATYVLSGFESTATEPFNIDLEYETPLSASQQAIMQAAAKSVAGLIGKGLPSAVVDGKIIDDINIKISTANIDGASGTQARTKIDFMRYGSMLPAQSLVQFDAADIAELERSGKLFSVVQHEFLHALGFGNLWEAKGLVNYAGTPLAQYNGGKAVDAFKDLGGLTDAISLETEGKGSAGFHWNEALFQDEVMTADLNFSGKAGNAPISPVTIASLADLGYEVNLKGATPDFGLFGGQGFRVDDLTPEQLEAFRELAETSFEEPGAEYIAPIMPTVDPDKVSPEIWAHAERFSKNGEYYDWEKIVIGNWRQGHTISDYVLQRMTHPSKDDHRSAIAKANDPDYWRFISNKNGFPDPNWIVQGNEGWIPVWHPNYEQEQEAERLQREAELRQRQEEEARIRREQEEAFARDQERVRQEEEARRREAEAQQRELEDQQRRLREQMERRRQEEERRLEEARLAELARQAEIARQQGKGGLDWYLAKPMPEFGPVDPFETSLTGETVGHLVPDDYYRFTLSRGGRITAELKKLLADADLVLYDVRNEPIAYSMREGITDEQIIADLIPGTYMLRVNSPKGVTTDYELIVKFKHKLSQSEIGPPLGWKVGGNGNSGGGGGASGSLFSDSRIQRIYDTALANFSVPERAKANAKIAELEREKRSYEQQMQELLDQMNAEQRQKVHQALDDARHNANVWVDGIANPIKGQVDNLADGIINKANSFANSLENTVNQVPDYGIGWVKDRKNDAKWLIRQGRDAVTSAVNSARSWLRGKLIEIQNGVNSAIQQFFDTIKNAYRTGAEINQIIANAAQTFRTKVDQAVRGANNLIGEFKGHVLSATDWTKNLGINVDQYGVKFNFNVYNNIVKPAVDGVADGFQSTISGIGSGLKGIIDWIEPRTQKTVADIVNAILGDKTGHLWNQINGVDAKIAATRTGVEKAIKDQGNLYKRLLDDFVNGLGSASNFVIGALMGEFNNDPSIWQVLLDSAIGMIPIAGEIGDVRDLIAYTKKFIDNPSEMQDAWNWVGVVGSLVGLVPVAGGAIKGVTKVARNADFVTEMRKLGPTIVDAVVDFAKRTDWDSLATKSKNFYLKILDTIEGLLRKLNDGIRSFDNLLPKLGILQHEYVIGKLPNEGFFADLADNVRQLRREVPQKVDKAFAFLKGKVDEVVSSRVPAPDNYRGRYNADRAAKGQPRLPDDWDAHHAIPQFYKDHPEFQNFDYHAPSNIRGVKGSRADENIHQQITNDWAEFQRSNPSATRLQIENFAKQIDRQYSQHWFQ
ncbi:S8 family serine peptidase [Microcoleus sp. D3_18_C2]|uniref:S8 family serine peptidase n=1 Tax=Microcoleus sp. D3_18_C2 TaxID=3055334 RepID=UPI002FD59F23